MFCLSFLMINVGYEFDIDKSKLKASSSTSLACCYVVLMIMVSCGIVIVSILSQTACRLHVFDLFIRCVIRCSLLAVTVGLPLRTPPPADCAQRSSR